MAEYWPDDHGCPQCLGRAGACHLCADTRRVDTDTLIQAMRRVWARHGCPCAACARIRATTPRYLGSHAPAA